MSTGSCHLCLKTLQGFPYRLKTISHILLELTYVFLYKLLVLHCPANILFVLLTPDLLSFPQVPRVLNSGPLSIFPHLCHSHAWLLILEDMLCMIISKERPSLCFQLKLGSLYTLTKLNLHSIQHSSQLLTVSVYRIICLSAPDE